MKNRVMKGKEQRVKKIIHFLFTKQKNENDMANIIFYYYFVFVRD